jgi:hypothetical protein
MKFDKQIDLVKVYANLDQTLINASANLESAIGAYAEFADLHATATIKYKQAKAEVYKRLNEEKKPVTLIKELAGGETANLKGELLKLEAKKNECKMLINAFEHRINTLKFIGKKTAPLAGDYDRR